MLETKVTTSNQRNELRVKLGLSGQINEKYI